MKLIIKLLIAVLLTGCGKEKCTEAFLFEFETTNDLKSTEIQSGMPITVRVEFPGVVTDAKGRGEFDMLWHDFTTAVTFKRYNSHLPDMGQQQRALDEFDYRVLTGEEIPRNRAQLMYTTEDHSIYMIGEVQGAKRVLEFDFNTSVLGTYFVYFQSASELSDELNINIDNDNCIDAMGYYYNNISKNDHSVLDSMLRNARPEQGDFLIDWSGIAFTVVQ